MSCNICCDDFNKSTRAKVSCPYCDFETCRACCETYILGENIPKCMKPECGKEWSRKFLKETFTTVFLNSKYKKHLEEILFSREKSLMPATQPLVEESIRKRDIMKEHNLIERQITELREQQRHLMNMYHTGQKEERREFVRQCPANDCRGFLSSQWKCGLCQQWSCPDCHELKGLNRDCEHTCDPNSVETAKLLAKDSKPCPKCQCLIFKIDGCDQMWCTQCHTAFSWKTGNIENHIHNPHYYEWLRKTNGGNAPRNRGDVECGRNLNYTTFENLLNAARKHSSLYKVKEDNKERVGFRIARRDNTQRMPTYIYHQYIDFIQTIIRTCIHNVHQERYRFENNYILLNQDLRIKYLEKKITEDEFKQLIQRNDKKEKKNGEILQVINLSITVLTDIIYRLITHLNSCEINKHELDNYIYEIGEIRTYCNNIFKDIAFTYNSVQYQFGDAFEFKAVEESKKSKKKKTDDSVSVSEISDT